MSFRHEEGPPSLAREVYVVVIGVVLGLALVVGLTEDLGRRMCGGVGAVPGAALLFGCDR